MPLISKYLGKLILRKCRCKWYSRQIFNSHIVCNLSFCFKIKTYSILVFTVGLRNGRCGIRFHRLFFILHFFFFEFTGFLIWVCFIAHLWNYFSSNTKRHAVLYLEIQARVHWHWYHWYRGQFRLNECLYSPVKNKQTLSVWFINLFIHFSHFSFFSFFKSYTAHAMWCHPLEKRSHCKVKPLQGEATATGSRFFLSSTFYGRTKYVVKASRSIITPYFPKE